MWTNSHIAVLILLLPLVIGCSRSNDSHEQKETTAADTDHPVVIPDDRAPASVIKPLENETLDSFLNAGGPSLIEFGGKNCIPCRNMREILEEFASLRPDVRLGIVFWEDSPELFGRWNITAIPAQVVFDQNGRERTRHQGIWSLEELLTVFPETARDRP
jgi:thiol-disulfide isomerase/thioredoxin